MGFQEVQAALEERRLSAAVRAEQTAKLTLVHMKRDAIEDWIVAIVEMQVPDLKHGRHPNIAFLLVLRKCNGYGSPIFDSSQLMLACPGLILIDDFAIYIHSISSFHEEFA